MKNPVLEAFLESLPMDASVRIELVEGIPIFRAPPHVRARIEELLDQRETAALSADERQELVRYEELDEFLALVNRLVRNEALGEGLSRLRLIHAADVHVGRHPPSGDNRLRS